MPAICAAVGCRMKQQSEPNVMFYAFPRDTRRKKRWVYALKREWWTPTASSRVCSVHFISGRRSDDPESPDYVPSWFAHTTTAEKERLMAAMRRYRRRQGARVRKAAGRPMSEVELAALECFKNGLLPFTSDRNVYSLFPSLCQEYVTKSLMDGQKSSGSSEIPASISPAARPMGKVSPGKFDKQHRWSEDNKPREENPYLKAWLRHDYNRGKKPKSVDILSHLSNNGTLNIPSVNEVTSHPTRLHEDYCTPKSVQWAKGVWKKASCEVLPNHPANLSIKVTGKWEWLSLDVRGPLPETARGHRFLLIVMDLYSKWTEACPMKTSCAREVALNIRNLVCQLGLPHALFSQLSRGFIKAVNKALGIYMAMEDCFLVVFHPKACSLDPITFNDVGRAVRKLVTDHQESWDAQLRACLFALRVKRHPDIGQSPFYALYRRDPRDPSPDTPPELPVGLSDDHPISRILASPPLIDTHEPQPSRPSACLQAQMPVNTVVILSAVHSNAAARA
ncbi:hypothetical protein ANANG_G00293900 [Anguilla anguilla]|uniref:THAP-type domain-containing protein n=1 Tax=Anguilla anguilla TaxID=7936 RepID=A0A9D3LQC1_ANGAN|nr:hypothetical protein ANANG_G00293900 [Anguilla anguilla]